MSLSAIYKRRARVSMTAVIVDGMSRFGRLILHLPNLDPSLNLLPSKRIDKMNNHMIEPSTFLVSPLTKIHPSRKRSSPTDTKKPRKSRRIHDFPPESLAPFYHMPQRQAAKALNVAVITIKRNCKRYGFRWPYRANKYKAGKKFVLSDKGRAFHELPLECLKAATQLQSLTKPVEESTSECDTDTESVSNGEHSCKILVSVHKSSDRFVHCEEEDDTSLI